MFDIYVKKSIKKIMINVIQNTKECLIIIDSLNKYIIQKLYTIELTISNFLNNYIKNV